MAQCVNLVLAPTRPEADAGFIIMELEYYVPMSGTNTICTVTALLETGMVPMHEPVTRLTLEAPGGLVSVEARCQDGKCESVSFRNVPAFVFGLQKAVEVPGLGTLMVDVAYGGMIYVMVDAEALGIKLEPSEARDLVELGERIKRAAAEQIPAGPSREPGDSHDQPDLVCWPDEHRQRCEDGQEHGYRLTGSSRSKPMWDRHHGASGDHACEGRDRGRRKVRA